MQLDICILSYNRFDISWTENHLSLKFANKQRVMRVSMTCIVLSFLLVFGNFGILLTIMEKCFCIFNVEMPKG